MQEKKTKNDMKIWQYEWMTTGICGMVVSCMEHIYNILFGDSHSLYLHYNSFRVSQIKCFIGGVVWLGCLLACFALNS